jgi:hypothetical protein
MGRTRRRKKIDRRRAQDLAREVDARTTDGKQLIVLGSASTKTRAGEVDEPPDAGVREPAGHVQRLQLPL